MSASSALPATELLSPSGLGRRFEATRTVRLGDVDPAGELRLDAVARYLQDVASDDALDAGLPNAMGWLVRRTMIRVHRPLRLNERVRLATWCTGSGRSWAERRTSIAPAAGSASAVDAVSLWVQVDPDSGRPSRLGDEFHAIYGAAAAGRTVSSKLTLPRAPSGGERGARWTFRATDRDPFGHVNNAAQWALLEAVLDGVRTGTGEVEYLAPADSGVGYEFVSADDCRWLVGPDGVVTVLRWRPG